MRIRLMLPHSRWPIFPLDSYILPEAVFCAGGGSDRALCPAVHPGNLADGLIPYLADYDAYILENHGTVTVGTDLVKAYYKTETLEYNAKITYLSRLLGNGTNFQKKRSRN